MITYDSQHFSSLPAAWLDELHQPLSFKCLANVLCSHLAGGDSKCISSPFKQQENRKKKITFSIFCLDHREIITPSGGRACGWAAPEWKMVPIPEVRGSAVACAPSIHLDYKLTSLLQLTVVQTPGNIVNLFSPLCQENIPFLGGKIENHMLMSASLTNMNHMHKSEAWTLSL